MLKQHFIIERYDWEVYAFYYVESKNKESLYKFLEKHNYTHIKEDINTICGMLNGGYCYTNYNDRRTIMLINTADSIEQMCNTIVHELNHIGSHIEEYYKIGSHSEEACYLIGELTQIVSHFLT